MSSEGTGLCLGHSLDPGRTTADSGGHLVPWLYLPTPKPEFQLGALLDSGSEL